MAEDANTTTVQVQRDGETNAGTPQFASATIRGVQAICNSYFAQQIVDAVTEAMDDPEDFDGYMEVEVGPVGDDEEPDLLLDSVSGDGDGNYAIYETPNRGIRGLYLHRDEVIAEVTGDRDDIPEGLSLSVRPSDESEFTEAEEDDAAVEEEAESVVAG